MTRRKLRQFALYFASGMAGAFGADLWHQATTPPTPPPPPCRVEVNVDESGQFLDVQVGGSCRDATTVTR